jgi:hypothetical protein
MIRNLKVLGLALAATFALTAVAASAAQAAPLFHAEVAPVTYKGEQTEKHKFTTSAGTVECSKASFEGTNSEKTSSTVTLNAKYESCTAFGFLNATVSMNSCDYLFHLVEGSSPPTATVDIVCSKAGDQITISTFGCTTDVPPQTGLKHVTFANAGSGTSRDVLATIKVEGIHYTTTSESCPNVGAGTFTNGIYEGTATIKGFSGTKQQGIWVE